MTLRNYLQNVKTGNGRIVVVTSNDGNGGYDNYRQGHSFVIESNWDVYDANNLIETFPEELQELFEDCLDRQVLEVEAFVPEIELKRWAAEGAEADTSSIMKDVVVCVSGYDSDDDYWAPDDEDEGEDEDDETAWPYRFITREQYKAIDKALRHGFVSAGGYRYQAMSFSFVTIENIVNNGFDRVKKEITDEYIAADVAKAKKEYDAIDEENERRKANGEKVQRMVINRYMEQALLQHMKDVVDAAENATTFLAYLKISPDFDIHS